MELHESAGPQLRVLLFYAAWSASCAAQESILEELAQTYGLTLDRIEPEDQPALAERWGVTSVPTVILEKNGVEYGRFVGLQPATTLSAALRAMV
jgi:thioredoxin 1